MRQQHRSVCLSSHSLLCPVLYMVSMSSKSKGDSQKTVRLNVSTPAAVAFHPLDYDADSFCLQLFLKRLKIPVCLNHPDPSPDPSRVKTCTGIYENEWECHCFYFLKCFLNMEMLEIRHVADCNFYLIGALIACFACLVEVHTHTHALFLLVVHSFTVKHFFCCADPKRRTVPK